jgi:hypothetical protein
LVAGRRLAADLDSPTQLGVQSLFVGMVYVLVVWLSSRKKVKTLAVFIEGGTI